LAESKGEELLHRKRMLPARREGSNLKFQEAAFGFVQGGAPRAQPSKTLKAGFEIDGLRVGPIRATIRQP
jgi:hypothetical protein